MNLLRLNSPEVAGKETHTFNCGGFALGTLEWEFLNAFNELMYETSMTYDERVVEIAEEIAERFPNLTWIPSARNIPKRFKVIGFRVTPYEDTDRYSHDEDYDICYEELYDFHFIMRHHGVWYHKPGPFPIEKFHGNINGCWKWHEYTYISDIIWFVDTKAA